MFIKIGEMDRGILTHRNSDTRVGDSVWLSEQWTCSKNVCTEDTGYVKRILEVECLRTGGRGGGTAKNE